MVDYKCDRCGEDLSFDEVAYLGPVDRDDMECSAFQETECVCNDCEDEQDNQER